MLATFTKKCKKLSKRTVPWLKQPLQLYRLSGNLVIAATNAIKIVQCELEGNRDAAIKLIDEGSTSCCAQSSNGRIR